MLSTWTLCTIPNLDAALAEIKRVLKPGGSFHFIEHGHAPDAKVARTQARLEPLNKRLAGGCHLTRRIPDDIERAGKGVYSPTLRDNAQEARNTLFNMLATVPGAEAYAAIKALEEEHPEPDYRRWMAHRARERPRRGSSAARACRRRTARGASASSYSGFLRANKSISTE